MNTHKITYLTAAKDRMFPKDYSFSPTIAVIIPAHNEEDDIGKALISLSKQEIPDNLDLHIYIALDNCTDNTEEVIQSINKKLKLNIFLLETVDNIERKVGALNQTYHLFFGNQLHIRYKEIKGKQKEYAKSIQAFVGIDADAELEKDTISILWEELMSVPYVGSVSANYTCKFNDDVKHKRSHIRFRENWWVAQQVRDFADWTLRQKQNRHIAEIAGGQCSMFKPAALLEVRDKFKLNGFFDNSTDTEDLLITQHLRECGWTCLTSKKARCYVDSMNTYQSYFAQRKKWVSGTIDYMTQTGLKTSFSRKAWSQQFLLLANFLIRVLLITLIPISIWLNVFTWSWIWAIPFITSAILNVLLTLLSPDYRMIDILLTGIGINQEIYLWITMHVHISTWVDKLGIEDKDGWELQYKAEKGLTRSPVNLLPVPLLGGLLFLVYHYRDSWMSNQSVLNVATSYLKFGYPLLTFMTILMTINVIWKIWKLRYPFKP